MANRLNQIAGSTNPLLSKFAAGYKNPRLIGDIVVPDVEVITPTGTYYSLGKEGFQLYNSKRALRANSKQILNEFGSSTYACVEHALENPIDYREIENAERYGVKKVLDVKQQGLMMIDMALAIEKEKAKADILMSTTYYASGNKTTLSGTDQWSDKTNSDPLGDIDTGMQTARGDMGIEPNTVTFGYVAWKAFSQHPTVLSKIKNNKNNFVTVEDAKELLGVANIYIGQAVYATDAGVFTDIWGDAVALHYLPGVGELAAGVPIHTVNFSLMGYPKVKEYPNKKTIDIEETQIYVPTNISTSNGYLILDTVA